MRDKANLHRSPLFLSVLVAAALAAIIMNVTSLHYEPFPVWVRVVAPLSIFLGLYGFTLKGKFLRLIGWIGIGLFVLCALQMILPGEDYMSSGPDGPPLAAPRLPNYLEIGMRFVTFMVVTTVLICGFWRLGNRKKHD